MPIESTSWYWEEAFDKFGFDDGDGLVLTHLVAEALRFMPGRSLTVHHDVFGMHNDVITNIFDGGIDLWSADIANPGYDDPRNILPGDIIAYLNEEFPAPSPVPYIF